MKHIIMIALLMTMNLFAQLTATDIIEKSDKKMRGKTNRSIMSMKIVRPEWSREMTMKSWSKGEDYFLLVVTEPAKDKGTASLKRESELWNWFPNIERTVKISSSLLSQSWMGSDFKNDDLLRESSIIYDYDHEVLGEEVYDEVTCYKIQMIPKQDAAIVWGKVVIWISKEHFNQRKVEYYDEDDFLVNTMYTFDVKEMSGRKIPTRMEMVPAEDEGHKTILYTRAIEFDVPIKDSFFSLQNLKRVR